MREGKVCSTVRAEDRSEEVGSLVYRMFAGTHTVNSWQITTLIKCLYIQIDI